MRTFLIGKVQNHIMSVLKGAPGQSISRILSSNGAGPAPGRSSIWQARRRAAQAVYPGLAS